MGKYINPALIVGDFVAINLALWLSYLTFGQSLNLIHHKWIWLLLNIALGLVEITFPFKQHIRFFYIDRMLLQVLKSVVAVMCVFSTLLYILDIQSFGLWTGLTLACYFFVLLSLWRSGAGVLLKKFRRMGFNYQRVIIVGSGKTASELYKQLQSDSGYGFRLMGFFDDDARRLEKMPGNFHGTFDQIDPFVRLNDVDIIYYTLNAENHDKFSSVMALAEELGITFIYVPLFNPVLSGQFEPSKVGVMPCMVHTFTPLNRGINPLIKRAFDLVVSGTFLLVSPIIFIPIAIAIKCTSKGPVFFKQKRTGIHGSEFMCYKFRSMKVNVDADRLQATEDDPRKTKLGDFLRRSSLDELPQFYNVFVGNMSVVGPRPHMISHTEEYTRLVDKYMIRHAVKPGITGWAQVNGYRGGTKHLWQMEKRVEYDVWYITNWNIFLDFKIVLMTIFNGLRGEENAY